MRLFGTVEFLQGIFYFKIHFYYKFLTKGDE